MRIAHIIDSLGWGGAQKLLVTFAEVALQRGISLTIISLSSTTQGAPFKTDLEKLGIRIVTFHGQRLIDPPRIFKLFRFLQQEQFDIVHTHLSYANILGPLACTFTKTPVVATLHNIKVNATISMRNGIEHWLLKRAVARIIVVGQQVAKARQHQFPGEKLYVVPNAVTAVPCLPNAERMALRRKLIGDTMRPLLINVGRLTPQKGLDDLLNAFAQVCQTYPQAALIIAGDGDILPDLARQIKSLGLENNAWLLGGRSDVPHLLAASDLYVSAAHWEGLPIAMLEAMSAGLPVVATGVGDVPVVLTAQTGIVVPPREPAKLAQAIKNLLDNQDRLPAMGAAAREHVTRYYSPLTWLDRLLAVYQEVLPAESAALLSEV
jgi:glycosyltransferase involved in cell wall biosynthesis